MEATRLLPAFGSCSAKASTPSRFFSCVRLACKNLRLLFGLVEKHRKRTFSARKTRISRNLRRNVIWQKASVISLDGKQWKMQFTTTLSIKRGQYTLVIIAKSVQTDLIIRKKKTVYGLNELFAAIAANFVGRLNGLPLRRRLSASRKNFRRLRGYF